MTEIYIFEWPIPLTPLNFKSNITLTIHSFNPFISSDFFYSVLLLSAINLHVECLKINVSLTLCISPSPSRPLSLSLSLRPRILFSFQHPGSTLTYAYVNGSASEPVEVIVCIFNWPIDWQIGIDCLVYLSSSLSLSISFFLTQTHTHTHAQWFFFYF